MGAPAARPRGVFDLDQTLTDDNVIELTKRSSSIKPSSKGKGKGKATDEDDEDEEEQNDATVCEDLSMQLFQSLSMPQYRAVPAAQCGICFDDFRVAENPYLASISATSSVDRNKGLRLQCGHQYCLGCASQYLKTELEKGPGSEWMISCPEVSFWNRSLASTSA